MKDWIVRVAVGLLVLATGGVLVWTTEWVDKESPTPAHGEAAINPLYVTQGLLRELGAKVELHTQLDAMPPLGVRLVLVSGQWDMFPRRERLLRDWVAGGGHLIISPSEVGSALLKGWLPMVAYDLPRQPAAPKGVPKMTLQDWDCRVLTEHRNGPALGDTGSHAGYRVCGGQSPWQYAPLVNQPAPLWAAQGPRGVEALRMPFGRGSVTVLGAWALTRNSDLFLEGSARLVSAALQARTGAVYWFVVEEAREPLLSWLWDEAWPACGLTLLAGALALWRAVPRFGAMALPARVDRRSMAEQVRGTGRFLHWHGASALHAAQVRALNEAAQHALRGFAQAGGPRRTSLVAEATGLDVAALARALIDRTRVPAVMAHDLELLETARRRLLVRVATHRQNPPAST